MVTGRPPERKPHPAPGPYSIPDPVAGGGKGAVIGGREKASVPAAGPGPGKYNVTARKDGPVDTAQGATYVAFCHSGSTVIQFTCWRI